MGYFKGSLGLGETARRLARSLKDLNLSCRFMSASLGERDTQDPGIPLSSTLERSDTLIFMNPPEAWSFLRKRLHILRDSRRIIGIWFWETESIPEDWIKVSRLFDEVWVASHWSKLVFEPVLHCPVKVFPVPVDAFGHCHGSEARSFAGVPISAEKYIFLNVFDYRSSFERKNPLACIRAFKRAFPKSQISAQLLIKTLNAATAPDKHVLLLDEAAEREDIVIRDMELTSTEMDAIYRRADCFLSLHRSEGLGMGFLQSVASGKSAIITDYSAPAEFSDLPRVYPVRYAFTSITADIPSYQDCQGTWAEADVEHAAGLIQQVVEAGRTPALAGDFGRHTVASFGQFIQNELMA